MLRAKNKVQKRDNSEAFVNKKEKVWTDFLSQTIEKRKRDLIQYTYI